MDLIGEQRAFIDNGYLTVNLQPVFGFITGI